MRVVLFITALALAGCNSILGIGGDVTTRDGGMEPPPPPPPIDARMPLPQQEVVTGAGTVVGQQYRADVQIGHPLQQAPVKGASHTAEGNAAVKP